MNKNVIIKIVIIIASFGGSAYVLYTGLYQSNNYPILQPLPGVQLTQQDLLPNGNTLNFKVINPQRFQFDVIQFPKVDPTKEVGITENQLIIPTPTTAN